MMNLLTRIMRLYNPTSNTTNVHHPLHVGNWVEDSFGRDLASKRRGVANAWSSESMSNYPRPDASCYVKEDTGVPLAAQSLPGHLLFTHGDLSKEVDPGMYVSTAECFSGPVDVPRTELIDAKVKTDMREKKSDLYTSTMHAELRGRGSFSRSEENVKHSRSASFSKSFTTGGHVRR